MKALDLDLRWRCRIEQKTTTLDSDYGSEVVTWSLLDVAWCEVQDVLPSRSEAVRSGLRVAINQTRVRMRYRSDVDSAMRLVINRPDPIIYQIVAGPAELGMKEGIEFVVEKYTTAGSAA